MQTEVVSLHFIRANGVCEYVQLDTSFKSASDGGEWSVSHADRSTSGQTAPTEQEFVWTPKPICKSSSGGKSLAPAGILSVKKNMGGIQRYRSTLFNPLNPELNPICYLLTLLGAHHFLHVSRIRVKLLKFRLLMSYIYGAPILDVSRSHTTTQHSR